MNFKNALAMWESVRLFRQAFQELQTVIGDVQARAGEVVRSPAGTPPEFTVALDAVPSALLTFRRNLFSTLFQSTYHLLNIDSGRRLLYGKLNYLFRIWVTSADNLLDDEDKLTMPIRMPGRSQVMRQVVAIMAADRILARLLDDAVREGLIGAGDASVLSAGSLQVLLPSAAQEASEEGGIASRPRPEYVLQTLHRLKTGLLFHLPFLGPEQVERGADRRKMEAMKKSLMSFAIGCQILDDIRDIARDHRERRHNYILSCLHWSGDPFERTLDERQPEAGARVYAEVPHVILPAVRLAMTHLREGLAGMSREGLALHEPAIDTLAGSLFEVLDLADLSYAR